MKTLKKYTAIVMFAVMMITSIFIVGSVSVFADEIQVSSQEELVSAVENAKSGDTIVLGAGTYTTYGLTATKGKSLTFVGQGADKTTWGVGVQISDGQYYGEYKGDYSFDGSENITLKNMKITLGSNNYLGFIRVNNLTFENATVEGKITYGGTASATYKNVTFNAPGSDYSFEQIQAGTTTFDGCTFNAAGKIINAYTEGSGKLFKINFTGCTVNSTKANKSVINIKDNTNNYEVTISGNNTVDGLKANKSTCSDLYMVEKVGSKGAVVTIDGTTIWENGAIVDHSFTNGARDDAYTVSEDGTYKTCDYCGYRIDLCTVTYDLQGGSSEAADSYSADIGSKITAASEPTKDGFDFVGWFEDAEGQKEFDFDSVLTGDVTIYAVWKETPVVTEPTTEPTTKIEDETPESSTKVNTETNTKNSTTTTTKVSSTTATTTRVTTTQPATEPIIVAAVTRAPQAQTTRPATTEATTTSAEQTTISDETPLASSQDVLSTPDSLSIESSSSWALLNVILVVISLAVAVTETIKFVTKKSEGNNGLAFIVAMFALVANALILFMTQDFTASMAFVDSYTILNGIITLASCVAAIALTAKNNAKAKRSSK